MEGIEIKKRPMMARIANNFCKKIYVTDDNPRNENPKKIRNQIFKYISKNKAFNIGNRELAIKHAIKNAAPYEVILVAGKGHEEEQIYIKKVLTISDKKIIKKINIYIYKNTAKKNLNYLQNKLILEKILKRVKLLNFKGLSIDSRTIKKGNLFLAIKGKLKDGNIFTKEAIKKGAGCVITSLSGKKNKKIIYVKDTILFLNRFAKLKRENSFAKIISITGSAGKTSLKF